MLRRVGTEAFQTPGPHRISLLDELPDYLRLIGDGLQHVGVGDELSCLNTRRHPQQDPRPANSCFFVGQARKKCRLTPKLAFTDTA